MGAGGELIVSSGSWSEKISLEKLNESNPYWSPVSNESLIEVTYRDKKGAGFGSGKFHINIYHTQKNYGGRLESVIYPPSAFEEAYDFEKNAALKAAANSVAILVFSSGAKAYGSCSGFLIDSTHVITNAHCLNTESECASTVIIFGYKKVAPDDTRLGTQYRCSQLLTTSQLQSLDIAVLKIQPSAIAPVVPMKLSESFDPNGTIMMLEHPQGETLKASRQHCAITSAFLRSPTSQHQDDLGHSCDAAKGSSGSPLLDSDGKLIGVHHWGIDSTLGDLADTNRAVRLDKLRAALQQINLAK
nr:serine protease [Caballeronia sp. NCTM1]